MWASISKISNSLLSFIRTGSAPKDTPVELRELVKKQNHFASRKFYIVFSAFLGLCFFYFTSIAIYFILPSGSEYISGYVTIFSKTIEVLAVIIAAYLGAQAVVDLRYNSNSQASFEGAVESITSVEKIDQHIILEETIKYSKVYKDDPSYAPLEWVESYDNETD